MAAAVAVDGLSVVFGRTIALDDVTLSLDPGVVGLFGPNGSGKSTLLRVLAGLLRPTSGGVSVVGAAPGDLRGRIGYAGHDSGLYPQLTVAENLELFARLYRTGTGDVVDAVGLADVASIPVGRLSAGMQRRAAVARAMVHRPDVLLLDEPYANLDDDAAELVSAAVQGWRAPGRIAVIATHGAKRVKSFADGGVILRRGRVVVAGTYRAPSEVS
jgi:heme exporter protein A